MIGKSITVSEEVKFFKLRLKGWARFVQVSDKQEVGETKIINWALVRVDLNEGEFEGKKIYTLKFKIKDWNEKYFVDIWLMTWIGRSIASSLFNIQEYGKIIELSLYSKKSADKTKSFDNIMIYYNWEVLKWKYNITDKTDKSWLPAVKKVRVQWQDTYDSYDRDMFLKDKLKEHLSLILDRETLDEIPNKQQVSEQEAKEVFNDVPF